MLLVRWQNPADLTESDMPKPTIVLVHGAWADGSSWNAVSTGLQGQGFTVLTPPNLLHGVAGDAAYVASFLTQRTTGPVVLVGHSYGGVVITNAGTAGGDVKALVYVDAFIPEVGETVFQILGGSGSAFDIPDPTAVFDIVGYPGAPEGDAEAFLKRSTVHEAFAQDLSEADRWLIVASQRRSRSVRTPRRRRRPPGRPYRAGPWSEPKTASYPLPPSAAWPSGQARPPPKSRDRTCRWCPTLRLPSKPSSPLSPPSAINRT